MNPDVSVIIPIYKAEKYIERNVRSLMEQTLENMEFIFVDDCSPDNSVDVLERIIQEYPDRIHQVKILRNDRNSGAAISRNKGFLASTGNFIIYCDSDDWVDTTMYQSMYETAIAENADIVSCGLTMVYNDGSAAYMTPTWTSDMTNNIKAYLVSYWTILVNLLISRDVYKRFISDDEQALSRTTDLGISFCEDFHLSVRLLFFANKIVNIHKPFYFYNQLNNNSVLHNINKKAMYERIKAHLDIIEWFKNRNQYDTFRQELCWRVLLSKRVLIWDKADHKDFLSIYPDSHNYINTCPYLTRTHKIIIWSITHKHTILTNTLLDIMNLKKRLTNK